LIKKINQISILISLPQKVMILEKREDARLIIDSNEFNTLIIEKSDTISSLPRKFTLQLLDISHNGLSFKISSQYKSNQFPAYLSIKLL